MLELQFNGAVFVWSASYVCSQLCSDLQVEIGTHGKHLRAAILHSLNFESNPGTRASICFDHGRLKNPTEMKLINTVVLRLRRFDPGKPMPVQSRNTNAIPKVQFSVDQDIKGIHNMIGVPI